MFACTYSYSVDFVCSTSYIIVFNSVILMSPVSICLEQCMTSEMFSNLFSCYLVFFFKRCSWGRRKIAFKSSCNAFDLHPIYSTVYVHYSSFIFSLQKLPQEILLPLFFSESICCQKQSFFLSFLSHFSLCVLSHAFN